MLEGDRFEVDDPWDHLVIGNFDDVGSRSVEATNTASAGVNSQGSGGVILFILFALWVIGSVL